MYVSTLLLHVSWCTCCVGQPYALGTWPTMMPTAAVIIVLPSCGGIMRMLVVLVLQCSVVIHLSAGIQFVCRHSG